MTPESVRRETLLLASGGWVGPWQVLLRVGELDQALLGTEIVALVSAALADLADSGCLRFVRGDPTLGEGVAPTELARSDAMAAIRDTGWRAATPAGDIWFTLTPKCDRTLDRRLARRLPRRRARELGRVVAGFVAAVRGIIEGHRLAPGGGPIGAHTDRRRGADRWRPTRAESPRLDSTWLDINGDLDDDAGLSASPVPRRPLDRSGSGAAAVVPEPDYRFEIEGQRIA